MKRRTPNSANRAAAVTHYPTTSHTLLRSNHCLGRLFLLIAVTCYLSFPGGSMSVLAQDDENSEVLTVTGIDTRNFPDIQVSLYGENLGINLNDLPIKLFEDTFEQPVQSRAVETVGIQVAFVLDASNNIRDTAGNSGQPGYVEYQRAIETFVDNRSVLSSGTDWTAAFTTGSAADRFRPIADWTQDHGALRNEVLQYVPDQNTPRTSLFELITYVLDQFEDSRIPNNLMKSIVLFSDGFDATSDLDIGDAIRRAEDMNVRIYTVMLGPSDPPRIDNLERIAKLTNGTYTFLRDPVNDLDDIWNALARQQRQLLLSYRLAKAQPLELEVRAEIPNQPALVRTERYPVVPMQPVVIDIVQPTGAEPIVREQPDAETPLTEVEPKFLTIQLEFRWPDGRPRTFQRIEYTINDKTETQDTEPFGQYAFPIEDLESGEYTLRVRAIDEFGLTSGSVPLPLAVQLIEPTPEPTATPTDTVTPTPTPTLTPTPSPTFVAIAPLEPPAEEVVEPVPEPDPPSLVPYLLLIALLLLFLFLYRRWRKRREYAENDDSDGFYTLSPVDDWSERSSQQFQQTDDATEVPASPPFTPEPAAYLVAVAPQPRLPDRITLHTGSIVRIGRKPELNDIVLDDKQISRVHAIITQKEDGGFYIKDEGSTGGTYVNRRKLMASDDRLLRADDLINFFSIAYRFEPVVDDHTEIPTGDYFATNSSPTNAEAMASPAYAASAQRSPNPGPMTVQPEEDQTEYVLYEDEEKSSVSEENNVDQTERE